MAGVLECMGGSGRHPEKPTKSIVADVRALELMIAKQILAEVFHTRLGDVEDMIMRRLVEKDRIEVIGKHANWGTWPEMFQAEECIKS
jgi:hypothetical protein